jgi:hypothetical protein
MRGNLFTAYAVDKDKRLANSPIGAVPGHHVLTEYRRKQGEVKELTPSWKQSGPALWTTCIKERSKVLPAYMFLPVFHSGYKNVVNGTIYAEHYWGTTKKEKKEKPCC